MESITWEAGLFRAYFNTAGGYSFYRDARLRRLTRYRYNNTPLDAGGRYIYLRDQAGGEFWSPSWQPTRTNLERYACRHGLGYTIQIPAQRGRNQRRAISSRSAKTWRCGT